VLLHSTARAAAGSQTAGGVVNVSRTCIHVVLKSQHSKAFIAISCSMPEAINSMDVMCAVIKCTWCSVQRLLRPVVSPFVCLEIRQKRSCR